MHHPFRGVLPAITTPFHPHGSVDHAALARQVRFLVEQGCSGVVACGSLGEGATLSADEKSAVMETAVSAAGVAPVIAGIAAASTAEARRLAVMAQRRGCDGLMVLPPYIYSSDWPEMAAHASAVIRETELPCMLYNNPIAYRTDFTPQHIGELAGRHENLVAVKESSGDLRRISTLIAHPACHLDVGVGIDELIVDGVAAGASFWVADLAGALPCESVQLFRLAQRGTTLAAELLRWFLPLLRFDSEVKFVQLIKLVQEQCGVCSARVRPPRLPLAGDELHRALETIATALATRPTLIGPVTKRMVTTPGRDHVADSVAAISAQDLANRSRRMAPIGTAYRLSIIVDIHLVLRTMS